MPSAIMPYNRANVAADQPWLAEADIEYSELLAQFLAERHPDLDEIELASRMSRADEGDRTAFQELYPNTHYILTQDCRIVEEPNFYRWGLFLEKAAHRQIDFTPICNGIPHRCPKHPDAPSFKSQETTISTVFVGTGINELFETMIFGGPLNRTHWRHQTILDAKRQHWKAVDLARKARRYMKQHGRSFRKDWLRLQKIYDLARKRSFCWFGRHISQFEALHRRLNCAPGPPPIPQPDLVRQLAQMFLSRIPL